MSQVIKQMGVLSAITGNATLSQNGCIQIGDVLIQWGVSNSLSPERGGTVTFPKPFPNTCFTVIAGSYCGSGAGSDVWAQVNSWTTSGFSWFGQASGDIVSIRCNWIAIGN